MLFYLPVHWLVGCTKIRLGFHISKLYKKNIQHIQNINKSSYICTKISYIMNAVGVKIRQMREQKGITQDYMAIELGLTQSSYARLEKQDKRIYITRLMQIAKLLQTTVGELIGEKAQKVINQQNSENPQAYNVDTIINADKDHIQTLKEENAFLRKLLQEKLAL